MSGFGKLLEFRITMSERKKDEEKYINLQEVLISGCWCTLMLFNFFNTFF